MIRLNREEDEKEVIQNKTEKNLFPMENFPLGYYHNS